MSVRGTSELKPQTNGAPAGRNVVGVDEDGEEIKRPDPPPGAGMRWGSIGMPTEKSTNLRATARKLADRMGTDRFRVYFVLLLTVLSAAGAVVGPKILGRATDIIVTGAFVGDGVDWDELRGVLLLALGLYVGSALISYLVSYTLAGIVQRTMRGIRADVETKLNRLPLGYVDRTDRGDLLSRVTNDIDNVSQSLQQSLSQLLSNLLLIVGTVGMMIWISPLLSLVALLTIPISLYTVKSIAKFSRLRFIDQWKHTGHLNAQVEEAFTGHSIVKAFGRQQEVEARFRETNDRLYDASFGAQFISGTIQPASQIIGNLNFIAVVVLGALRINSGAMTIGEVQAFIQYSRQFAMPLTHIASMFNLLQSGMASAERVFEFLEADEELADPPASTSTPPALGRVEFEHVQFSYDPKKELITDLSLVAEPGQTVAIVGHTGAGKTTLVNLIMRFYELDGGRITIDGRDISSIPRRELRSQIGMVLQDTWLFNGTIRDNIAYGNLAATEEEIVAAAKATYVDRFVHSLPDGYDTIIDDEGSTVSAGEKQLITIARAFLSDPSILILDEATSSVDTRTEVLIQRAMAALRSQRTSFVIAHRLSTIRDADIILVMDQGRIVEQGHHTDLLARGGAYAELYNSQFTGAATEVV